MAKYVAKASRAWQRRNSMTRNRKWLLVAALLAVLALAAVACGGNAATNTPPPPTATAVPTVAPTEESVAFSAVEKPTELNSFRSEVELTWQGTFTDSTEATGTLAIAAEFVREPQAEHLTINGNVPGLGGANLPADKPAEIYLVGGNLYTNILGSWMQLPADAGGLDVENLAFSVSEEMLKQLKDAKYEGKETYNGVQTRHYSFDQSNLNLADLPVGAKIDKANGNVYVALEGNYLVHMDMEISGINVAVPTGAETRPMEAGTVKMTADVLDVNQPITIQVPAEALAGTESAQDIPLPPDAEQVSTLSGMTAFQSASTPQQVAEFYKAEMPKNGWTQTQDEPSGDVYTLAFAKESRTASFVITADSTSGKTSVVITMSGQ